MSWREQMTPASFRGVEFLVESDERTGGRDGESHSMPGSDAVPFVEDTGIKGRVFRLEGFLVGADCLEARNSLLTALELPGSGELVHPTYGVRRVQVQDFASRYSSKAGGLVTLSLTFAETSAEPSFAVDVISPDGVVETAASTFRDASLAQFLAQFVVVPYSAEMQAQLSGLAGAVQQVSAVRAMGDDAAAALWYQSTALAQDSAALLADPARLASSIRALLGTLTTGLKDAASGLSPLTALLTIYNANSTPRPPAATPDGVTNANSFDALDRFTKREVLDQAAGITAANQYETHEDAVGARAQVTDTIDTYCESIQDDSYDTMMGLRRALCQAVPAPDQTLPHLREVSTPSSVPSLVLSYTLYKDLAHEEGLLRRNRVADPTYLPAGVPLEVLSS